LIHVAFVPLHPPRIGWGLSSFLVRSCPYGGKEAVSATVVAREAVDKRVAVRLKAVTRKITQVSIRVGTFSDKTK
jgi:hypothetical protein